LIFSTPQVVRAALATRAQIVHLHDPELLWALPILRVLSRVVVYDAHEDLPAQVCGKEYLGRFPKGLARMLATALVRAGGHADAIVAATPAIARRFPARRTTVIRNVPRLRATDDVARPIGERPLAAVYVGALSRDRGIDVLAGLATPDLPAGWRILTAGPIDPAVDRTRFDAALRSGRIEHRGLLPPDPARDLLLEARVGLLPLLPTPAYSVSIPTKLFEYWAAGLAVIATDTHQWRALLRGVDCVTWVPPGDSEAVVRALHQYSDAPDLLERHATAGWELVRAHYRWDEESRRLLDLYEGIFGTAPTAGVAARTRRERPHG